MSSERLIGSQNSPLTGEEVTLEGTKMSASIMMTREWKNDFIVVRMWYRSKSGRSEETGRVPRKMLPGQQWQRGMRFGRARADQVYVVSGGRYTPYYRQSPRYHSYRGNTDHGIGRQNLLLCELARRAFRLPGTIPHARAHTRCMPRWLRREQ